MSKYTPTTEQARTTWAMNWVNAETPAMSGKEARAEFDRWLASVKADAWQEGWVALGIEEGYDMVHVAGEFNNENPYRGEQA